MIQFIIPVLFAVAGFMIGIAMLWRVTKKAVAVFASVLIAAAVAALMWLALSGSDHGSIGKTDLSDSTVPYSAESASAVTTNDADTQPEETYKETNIETEAYTEAATEVGKETSVSEEATEAYLPIAEPDVTDHLTEEPALTEDTAPTETVCQPEESAETAALPAESETATPVETDPPETAAPDYDALAKDAYSKTVNEAIAYISGTPRGNGFDSFPFERVDTYSSLNEAQKAYYDEMLAAVESFSAFEYCAERHNLDDVYAAYEALMRARPDLQCYFTLDKELYKKDLLWLKAKYFLPSDGTAVTDGDKAQILSEMAYFEAVCDFIVASMPKNITVYDKYRYLASVVTLTTSYDLDFEFPHNNATAYGSIIGGKTICYGYTVGYEYLCAKADLYCTRVSGITHIDSVHMWNLGKISDGTYHIDVTWSDNGVNKPCTTGWMKYFMVTQEKVLEDHVISDGTVATGK